MNNKIIISGSGGFVGRTLTKKFEEHGFIVTILGKSKSKHKNFKWKLGESLPKEINQQNFFIHCAYDTSSSDTNTNKNINVIGLKKIIDQIKNLNITFIFITSQAANKKNNSVYSKVKIKCESLIKNNLSKYIIVRPGMIIDFNEKSHIIEMIKKIIKFKFFPYFSLEKKIQPIFLNDFAELIIKILKNKKINTEYQICQLTKMNLKEFVEFICKKLNLPLPYFIFIPLPFLLFLARILDIVFYNKISLNGRIQGLEVLKKLNPKKTIKMLNYNG